MKFPQTKHLKEELNKKGKVCMLPISYIIEFLFNISDRLFSKREEEK